MATDYRLTATPPKWISAHRDNNYTMRLPSTDASSGYNDGSGFLKVNLAGAFLYPVAVGDRIYITTSPYIGFHIVKTVHSSIQYTFETAFTSTFGGSVTLYQATLPEISIYKGYNVGEMIIPWLGGSLDLSTVYPYTLVATIKPEAGVDGFVRFNICGFVKTVIDAPYKGRYNADETDYNYLLATFPVGVDYNAKYFNKVRLILNGGEIASHLAVNSAISSYELNRDFVQTYRQLSPLLQAPRYANALSIGNYIGNNYIVTVIA